MSAVLEMAEVMGLVILLLEVHNTNANPIKPYLYDVTEPWVCVYMGRPRDAVSGVSLGRSPDVTSNTRVFL